MREGKGDAKAARESTSAGGGSSADVGSPLRFVKQEFVPQHPVELMREHPRNPRQGDLGALMESVDALGFYGAVVVQRSTGYVCAGNHRLKVAHAKASPTLPALILDVDDDIALRILLADNRLSDLASYDTNALATLLTELASGTEMKLFGTGYDGDAVDTLLKELTPGGLDAAGGGEPPESKYREQFGVIVMCADETDQETTFKTLQEMGYECRVVTT